MFDLISPWSNAMVTSSKKDFAEYPERVRSRMDDGGPVYKLENDRYAVHRSDDELEFADGKAERDDARPVYVLQPGGTPAVPTGLVFVRFKEGVKPNERTKDIEKAGYEIEQALDYAPEAAWLRAKSGEISDALKGIDKLARIADVENVEPQMLMRRASK